MPGLSVFVSKLSLIALVAIATTGALPLPDERTLKPGETFQECDDCPEMVVVPAGSFAMGSADNEKGRRKDEGPQHTVTIGLPFAVGKVPVTVDQFADFVSATGYDAEGKCWGFQEGKFGEWPGRSWRNPGFVQNGVHPAVCLSWTDAKAYADWVASKTGKAYRMLSEAEWEYAARGRTEPGSYPRYSFGDEDADICRYANVADRAWKSAVPGMEHAVGAPCNDGYAYTSPVGAFAPNEFGLYDMLGNARQWTADCHQDGENYVGAPSDGSAWRSGDCSRHYLRGGSWARFNRLAARGRQSADFREEDIGVRLARTLDP
jgi:formylglycine-generating enzyme required for sulfatase activity